jgi:hypothetical protein
MTDLRMGSRSPVYTEGEPNKETSAIQDETYSTAEALPVIFPTKCLYGLHAVPNGVLALLAFRRPEPNMACLTIWVSPVHSEPNVIVLKLAIAFERDTPRALGILAIDAGSEKWVATLGAKKVLFMICALPELGVVQSNKALVHDGCLAMIAPRCETLNHRSEMNTRKSYFSEKGHTPHDNRNDSKVCRRAHTN